MDRRSVLVVDDDPYDLLALEAALAPLGCEVVPARGGEEALRLLLERKFDAAVLDVMMPRLNGLETASLIHHRESSCALPLVLLTGFDEDGLKTLPGWSAALRVEYLSKPVEAETLRAKVERMLQGFSASVAAKQAIRSDSALTPGSQPSS
jgi:CheY-like chemotaxis protein